MARLGNGGSRSIRGHHFPSKAAPASAKCIEVGDIVGPWRCLDVSRIGPSKAAACKCTVCGKVESFWANEVPEWHTICAAEQGQKQRNQAEQTHPGFTIRCKACGSCDIAIKSYVDTDDTSGSTRGISLECKGCGYGLGYSASKQAD